MNSDVSRSGCRRGLGDRLFLCLFLPSLIAGIYIAVSAGKVYGLNVAFDCGLRSDGLFRFFYLALPFAIFPFGYWNGLLSLLLRALVLLRAVIIGFVFCTVFYIESPLFAAKTVCFDFFCALALCLLLESQTLNARGVRRGEVFSCICSALLFLAIFAVAVYC